MVTSVFVTRCVFVCVCVCVGFCGYVCVCIACQGKFSVQRAVPYARQEIAMEITVLIQTARSRWDILQVTL